MSDKKYDDPTGRAVCVFDEQEHAKAARDALVEEGFPSEDITVLDSKADASEIDVSAKWFADTDEDITRYKHEIEVGNTVVSVPAADQETLELVRRLFEKHGARMMTHFGDWVTTTEELGDS